MKILSWNIRQGGGSRAERIADYLVHSAADVVVLSEFRNNDSGHLIRIKLLVAGYGYQFATGEDGGTNGVLVASKAADGFDGFAREIDDFPAAVAGCRMHFGDLPLRLYGVYLPHKKEHSLFPFLLDKLDDQVPSIIAGDFNTGINGIDQKGDSFWYSEYLGRLNDAGYVDAFRQAHGDLREFSWYSQKGNGFRYDHTWVHESLARSIGDCRYEHSPRVEGLSDHSVMILELV